MASATRNACRMFCSVAPTSEPNNDPRSRTSVGRPVSLPSALANWLLPDPGTPSNKTPRGRTSPWLCSALRQNSFSEPSPPRSSKCSWPRCNVRSWFFLSVCDLSSHKDFGLEGIVPTERQRKRAFGFITSQARRGIQARAEARRPLGRSETFSPISSWAIPSSWPRSGSACSMTTNNFSNSMGSCTTGESTTTKVRCCLPVTSCVIVAWMTSGLAKKRWKLCSNRIAVPSRSAKSGNARKAANGSPELVSALAVVASAGNRSPLATSQTATRHSRSLASRTISRSASSGSWV